MGVRLLVALFCCTVVCHGRSVQDSFPEGLSAHPTGDPPPRSPTSIDGPSFGNETSAAFERENVGNNVTKSSPSFFDYENEVFDSSNNATTHLRVVKVQPRYHFRKLSYKNEVFEDFARLYLDLEVKLAALNKLLTPEERQRLSELFNARRRQKRFLKKFIRRIGSAARSVGRRIESAARGVGRAVGGAVRDVAEDVRDVAEDVGDAIVDIVEDGGDVIGDVMEGTRDLVEDIGDRIDDVVDDISDVITDVGEFLEDGADDVGDFLAGVGRELVDLAKDAGNALIQLLFRLSNFCHFPSPDSLSAIRPVLKPYALNQPRSGTSFSSVSSIAHEIRQWVRNSTVSRIIFVTHGYTGNINERYLHRIKNEILGHDPDQIVILVGWGEGARIRGNIGDILDMLREVPRNPTRVPTPRLLYGKAAANTQVVGQFIGDVATHIRRFAPDVEFYGIGHSLGAHVMGKAGRHSGQFARITGLDPAGPCFQVENGDYRLSRGDAPLVDVIHTDGYGALFNTHLGTLKPLGDLDFYPNWGRRGQPGCGRYNIVCSHARSVDLFTWSISNPGRFQTRKQIRSRITHRHIDTTVPGDNRGPPAEMGYHADGADNTKRGNFYLKTNSAHPYAK